MPTFYLTQSKKQSTLAGAAMGQIAETAASGQGSLSLGGTRDVSEIAAGLVTLATYADIVGTAPARRIHHQAWYGLGITPSGGPFAGVPVIVWHKFAQLETETNILDAFGHKTADTLYWDVMPGGVMLFEVDWP